MSEEKEIEARYSETNKELNCKKEIIKLLRDDGRGHQYPTYADLLLRFLLNFMWPTNSRPFVAAIDMTTHVIYINPYLLEKGYEYLISMVLRHELCHQLLMHNIRMMYKLGKSLYDDFSASMSILQMLNIIMDDEISNKRYSAEDKETARNLTICGQLLGGLVTEDHRADWKDLSLEEMYDRILEEIEEISDKFDKNDTKSLSLDDTIHSLLIQNGMFNYKDLDLESTIKTSVLKFVDMIKERSIIKSIKAVILAVANTFLTLPKEYLTDEFVTEQLEKIAKSSPLKPVILTSPETGEIIAELKTPEEKFVAVDIIKKFLSEYTAWFRKVRKYFTDPDNDHGTFTNEQIEELKKILENRE